MQELKLTDLLDVSVIKEIQDGFADFTNMATVTVDADGKTITEGSRYSELCRLLRTTESGSRICDEVICHMLDLSRREGQGVVECSEVGIYEFAAPVIVEGTFLGSIVGGQIAVKPLVEAGVRKLAERADGKTEEYLAAAKDITMIREEQIERIRKSIGHFARAASEMAYSNYLAMENSKKLEQSARAQSAFIMGMTADIREMMKLVLGQVESALEDPEDGAKKNALEKLSKEIPEWLHSIDETLEYARMTDGEIELNETEYDVPAMFGDLDLYLKGKIGKKNVRTEVLLQDTVPQKLLGDMGRLWQIVGRIAVNLLHISKSGMISVEVSCMEQAYASVLQIQISGSGYQLKQEEMNYINGIMRENVLFLGQGLSPENEEVGISVVAFLIRQMSGSFTVESNEEIGTQFIIHIPQLRVD